MPRLTTVLIFTGRESGRVRGVDAFQHARTGKSTSFIARKVGSSSASRLTVTRVNPASRSARAFFASSAPFVVNVRSTSPADASISTRRSRSRRNNGSPPVRRIFRTPWRTKMRGDARDLLERQQLRMRQEREIAAVHILRHAVDAAEVAAVGDRNAQVEQRPAARVEWQRTVRAGGIGRIADERIPRGRGGRGTNVGQRYDGGHELPAFERSMLAEQPFAFASGCMIVAAGFHCRAVTRR